jgi:hypothetical protein
MNESKKWEAHAGCLFCEKVEYDPYHGKLVLPGNKNKQTVFRVLNVGPGVEGYAVGDLIVTEKALDTVMGSFIRSPFVMGKLSVNHMNGNDAIPPSPASRAAADELLDAMTAAD